MRDILALYQMFVLSFRCGHVKACTFCRYVPHLDIQNTKKGEKYAHIKLGPDCINKTFTNAVFTRDTFT